jgi:hypothetical protein
MVYLRDGRVTVYVQVSDPLFDLIPGNISARGVVAQWGELSPMPMIQSACIPRTIRCLQVYITELTASRSGEIFVLPRMILLEAKPCNLCIF